MHTTHSRRGRASFLAHSCEPKESLLDFGVFMGFQGGQMSWAESSWIKIQVFLPRAHFCLTPRPALYSQKQLLNQCLTGRLPRCDFLLCSERGERRGHLEEQ